MGVGRGRGRTAAVLAVLTVMVGACGGGDGGASGPGDVAAGREKFATNCAACHGDQAQGTTTGPPLVHEYYVPSHHSDAAFVVAVQRGVQPHHWDFGAMPPQPGLGGDDVADITAYVRSLQSDAGLLD